jgi:uncharacterized protein YggU (UPF0235/DUF167 family)
MTRRDVTAQIKVTVKPKSSRQEVQVVAGRLVVCVTVPPAEGKANEMCRALVADWLGVPKSSILLLGGEHHREKVIGLVGIDQKQVEERLRKAIIYLTKQVGG